MRSAAHLPRAKTLLCGRPALAPPTHSHPLSSKHRRCQGSGQTHTPLLLPALQRLETKAGVPRATASTTATKTRRVEGETPAAASRPLLHPPPKGYVWYFAYGSNMNPDVLTKRRKVEPLEAVASRVEGYALSFRQSGLPYLEPAFATVLPVARNGTAGDSGSDGWAEVHGVAHLVSEAQWQKVQQSEGVGSPIGYTVISVACCAYDGSSATAYTLTSPATALLPESFHARPTPRYMNIIRQGARHHHLDPRFIAYLDSLPSYEANGTAATVGKALMAATALPLLAPLVPLVMLRRAMQPRQQEQGTAGVGPAAPLPRASSSTPAPAANGTTQGSPRGASSTGAGAAAGQQRQPEDRTSAPTDASPTTAGLPHVFQQPQPQAQQSTAMWAVGLYLDTAVKVMWGTHNLVLRPLLGVDGWTGNGDRSAGCSGSMNGKA